MKPRSLYIPEALKSQIDDLLSDCIPYASDPTSKYPNPIGKPETRVFAIRLIERAAVHWLTYLEIASKLSEFPFSDDARRIGIDGLRQAVKSGPDSLTDEQLSLLLADAPSLHCLHEFIDDYTTQDHLADDEFQRVSQHWNEVELRVGRDLLHEDGLTDEDIDHLQQKQLERFRIEQLDDPETSDNHALLATLGTNASSDEKALAEFVLEVESWKPSDLAAKLLPSPISISLVIQEFESNFELAISKGENLPTTARLTAYLCQGDKDLAQSLGTIRPVINLSSAGIDHTALSGMSLRIELALPDRDGVPHTITKTFMIP